MYLLSQAVVASADYRLRPSSRGRDNVAGDAEEADELQKDDNILLLRGSDLSLVGHMKYFECVHIKVVTSNVHSLSCDTSF